jgi:hypothetical protein
MEDNAVLPPGIFSPGSGLLFAVDRMDTWVMWAAIAIPLLCLLGLGLWHLLAWLAGKLPGKPRTFRQSPEPPEPPLPFAGDDPDRLQQACTTLERSLAQTYLELGESWLRRGQVEKAAAAFGKVLLVCPDRPEARSAGDHLEQIRKSGSGIYAGVPPSGGGGPSSPS